MTAPQAFPITINTKQARPRIYSTKGECSLIHPRSLLRKDEAGWQAHYRLVPRRYILHGDRRAELTVEADGRFAVT